MIFCKAYINVHFIYIRCSLEISGERDELSMSLEQLLGVGNEIRSLLWSKKKKTILSRLTTIRLSQENVREYLCDLGVQIYWNKFLSKIQKARAIRERLIYPPLLQFFVTKLQLVKILPWTKWEDKPQAGRSIVNTQYWQRILKIWKDVTMHFREKKDGVNLIFIMPPASHS